MGKLVRPVFGYNRVKEYKTRFGVHVQSDPDSRESSVSGVDSIVLDRGGWNIVMCYQKLNLFDNRRLQSVSEAPSRGVLGIPY